MKIGMAFLTLLLNSGVIFIGATANNIRYIYLPQNGNAAINYRLPNYVIPRHYNIELMPYIKEDNGTEFNFSGRMTATIEIYRPTYSISLHAQEPYIRVFKSRLFKENVDFERMKTDQEAVKYVYSNKTNILTFHFNTEISKGIYDLLMQFNGTAYDDSKGFFKTPYVDRNGKIAYVAGTRFQTIGARQVFPCWDEPAIKTKFNIFIRHHANYTVLPNATKLAMTNLDNNNMAWSRLEIPAIPIYLVAFIIINVEHFEKMKIEGAIWYRHGLAQYVNFAEIMAYSVMVYYQPIEWEQLRENFSKSFDSVAIPGLRDNGIANSELIFYREADIIYDEKLDSAMHKVRVANLVAREMIYQWLCNYMNPFHWSSFWLNDGIATLLGTYTIDKIYPNFRLSDLFVVQVLQESLHLDNGFIMKPLNSELETLSEIDSFAFSRYVKAPAILHMLQHVLTDNIFRHGIGTYLSREYYSLRINDLWENMQYAVKNSPYYSKQIYPISIKQMMNTWDGKQHYPVLKVKRDYTNHRDMVILVEKLGISKQDDCWIPVSFTTQTECNFTQSFDGKWLNITPSFPNIHFRLPYDEDGWIIINTQQSGYYRVNYDTTNWLRIIRFLHMYDHTKIHVLNRAQIIDDAFHLMLNVQLDPSVFWYVTSYLQHETDYIAWYPMFKALEYMSGIFPLQEKEVTEIKGKILFLLDNLLANIGYDEDPNENHLTKSLRQEAAKWACTLNSLNCINAAKKKLTLHLTDPETHKLLPWWKKWTYCKGMIMADNPTWAKLFRAYYERKSDYKILEAMTCYKNFNISKTYLDLAGVEHDILQRDVKGRVYSFFYIVTKEADDPKMIDYILTHFETVKPEEVSTVAALIYIINHIYNKKEFYNMYNKKIRDFVENNAKHLYLDIEDKIITRWQQIKINKRQLIYLTNF